MFDADRPQAGSEMRLGCPNNSQKGKFPQTVAAALFMLQIYPTSDRCPGRLQYFCRSLAAKPSMFRKEQRAGSGRRHLPNCGRHLRFRPVMLHALLLQETSASCCPSDDAEFFAACTAYLKTGRLSGEPTQPGGLIAVAAPATRSVVRLDMRAWHRRSPASGRVPLAARLERPRFALACAHRWRYCKIHGTATRVSRRGRVPRLARHISLEDKTRVIDGERPAICESDLTAGTTFGVS